MSDMIFIHDVMRTTVQSRRRVKHIGVSLLPGRHVLLSTKYGTVPISRAEIDANWPDKKRLIDLLIAKMDEAETLVRTRGRKAA